MSTENGSRARNDAGLPRRGPKCGRFLRGRLFQDRRHWPIAESQAIVITDRKDIIIRGGENLSAREIEEVVMLHSAVAEAAVAVSAPTRDSEKASPFCYVMRATPGLSD